MELTLVASLVDTRYGLCDERHAGSHQEVPCAHSEDFEHHTFDADMTLEPIKTLRWETGKNENHAVVFRFKMVGTDDNDCLSVATVPAATLAAQKRVQLQVRGPLMPSDTMTLTVDTSGRTQIDACSLKADLETVRVWRLRCNKRTDMAVKQVRMLL